ncbi:MAG: hypothetical protein J3Q66DRAFT_388220 [Benniella sp.]|nr:MAG: hypothetical protein J3Q66DRAFT_388220 [Benniella sp.]
MRTGIGAINISAGAEHKTFSLAQRINAFPIGPNTLFARFPSPGSFSNLFPSPMHVAKPASFRHRLHAAPSDRCLNTRYDHASCPCQMQPPAAPAKIPTVAAVAQELAGPDFLSVPKEMFPLCCVHKIAACCYCEQ